MLRRTCLVAPLLIAGLAGCGDTVFMVAAAGTTSHGASSSSTSSGSGGGGGAGGALSGANLDAYPSAIWGSGLGDIYVVGRCCEPFSPRLLRSTDGGSTFVDIGTSGDFNPSFQLYGVWGRGPGDLVVVGDNGAISRSTDAGSTWSADTSPAPDDELHGVWGAASGAVFAVGSAGFAMSGIGVILRSSDGSPPWSRTTSSTSGQLEGVWGSSELDVYAVGSSGAAGVILHTTDGGTTWDGVGGGSAATSRPVHGVWGTGAHDVFVAGDAGTFHSSDAGVTWARVDAVSSYAVWGSGSLGVYALAKSGIGTVVRRRDAGTGAWHSVVHTTDLLTGLWGAGNELFATDGIAPQGGLVSRLR